MPGLRLHPDAEQDLDQAAVWYDERSTGLGDQFLAEVLSALAVVLDAPTRHPLHPHIVKQPSPPVRRLVLERFPYSIAYQSLPEEVLVLAVAHAKRHPLYWTRRIL